MLAPHFTQIIMVSGSAGVVALDSAGKVWAFDVEAQGWRQLPHVVVE